MTGRKTEWLRNASLTGFAILVSVGLGELAVRWLRPQVTYSKLLELAGAYYAPSDYNTFQLKANYRGTEPSMERPGEYVQVTTDENRFRSGRKLHAGSKKIIALGDSFTFGVFVNDNETYPAVLDQRIGSSSDQYQVINAGFTAGWDTDQQYVWLKHNIGKLRPSLVILGVFLGNDITGIDPASWTDIDEKGLPGRWVGNDLFVTGAGYIKNRNKGLATVGIEAVYGFPILRESHLAILIGRKWDKLANSVEDREPYLVGEAFDHVYGHYSDEFLEKEALFLRLVQAMNSLAKEHGSAFAVALLPMSVMIERDKTDLTATYGVAALPQKFHNAEPVYYARLGKLLLEAGITAIDIESAMKQSTQGPFFPANGEVHFSANGHRFTAEQVLKFVKRQGLLSGL